MSKKCSTFAPAFELSTKNVPLRVATLAQLVEQRIRNA